MKSFCFLFSLLLGLITITTISQSREYHVKDKQILSYMHKIFYDINEKIFPADMRINVSVSRSVGTLLYSIDKNMNQLIVSLHDGLPHAIKVEFNRQEIIRSLPDLCGCASGRYEILDIRIQLNTHINIRCNAGNPYKVKIMKKIGRNENYPILYPRMNTNKASSNEAHLWLVNTPQYDNVYPNNHQMYGCIFKVSYMDTAINFTDTTSDITHPCKEQCRPNVCNGGECLEAYNDYPVCNCTLAFLNGRYCNESISTMNVQSSNQLFIFDMIKLSWISSVNTIFTISNTNVRISLDIEKENVYVKLKYLQKSNIKVTLSQGYVRDNPSICIAYFKDKIIDIWFFNNGSWSKSQILCEYELKREIFDSVTLQSGNGYISLYTKSNEDISWKRVHIVDPKEIKNDTTIGLDNKVRAKINIQDIGLDKVTAKMNIQGLSVNAMITLLVLIPFLIIIGLIIVIVIILKQNKVKNQYSIIKGNSDDYISDISDTHKDDTKQQKKDIGLDERTTELSGTELSQLLTKEYREYIKVCMHKMRYNNVKENDTNLKEWKKFFKNEIHIDSVLNNRLEKMYQVMKNITRENTYLSDIIVLLIHTRIFVSPSNSGVANFNRSIQYLTVLLSDKYNHQKELQGLSEQVIDCMMDFIEDMSPYPDPEKIFRNLLYGMLAFVGYNIVIDEYKYTHKRNVKFLQKYSSEDNLERLWSAVIMYANTREPKHITMLKEYLNENVIHGEILSKDMIMLSLAIIHSDAHNFDESILTHIDYKLIVDLKKYQILSKVNIQAFTLNIINIFNHKYKERIIQIMGANSDFTKEHKMSIECLNASLQKGLINEENLMMLTSLLNEFYPYAAKNNEADQIMQSVLNHLFEHKHYQNKTIKDKLFHLCIEYFYDKIISGGIKLSSSLIICYTAANITNSPRIDDVIEYLADIIGHMTTRGAESLNLSDFNLSITDIERVLSHIAPIRKTSKSE